MPLVLLSPLENDALHACLTTERIYHDRRKDFLEKKHFKNRSIPLRLPHSSRVPSLELYALEVTGWVDHFHAAVPGSPAWDSMGETEMQSSLDKSPPFQQKLALDSSALPYSWSLVANGKSTTTLISWNTGRLHTLLKITELFFSLRLLLWASETVAANTGQVRSMTTKSGHPKLDTGTVMAASVASSSTFKHLHD